MGCQSGQAFPSLTLGTPTPSHNHPEPDSARNCLQHNGGGSDREHKMKIVETIRGNFNETKTHDTEKDEQTRGQDANPSPGLTRPSEIRSRYERFCPPFACLVLTGVGEPLRRPARPLAVNSKLMTMKEIRNPCGR